MVSYLILCRSLTYAQRTAGILEQSGIKGRVARLPRSIARDGCGYCVRITERTLESALKALREAGIGPRQVYADHGDGTYGEVPL